MAGVITVAIIGAGGRGLNAHGQHIADVPQQATVVAAVDPKADRRELAMKMFPAMKKEMIFADWREFVALGQGRRCRNHRHINVDADKFIAAIREHNADLLGMSALLTTTMPYMLTVIERLKEEGLRDQVKVLVGGAPLNLAFAEDVGADRYCKDAAEAVEAARAFMAMRS